MLIVHILIALTLIPICSQLYHLGGQSTVIPCPRFTCRMVGTGVAFGVVSLLCGLGIENAAINGAIGVAGMIFASVWSNGSVFMALNRTDFTALWPAMVHANALHYRIMRPRDGCQPDDKAIAGAMR